MAKAPAHIVGIDFGNSSLKAVHLQKVGDQYALTRVAMIQTNRDSTGTTTLTEQAVGQQLKELLGLVKGTGADIHFSINSPNSTIRYIDLPAQMTLEDFRSALKLNSETFLRQKFDNFTFDACPLDADQAAALLGKNTKKNMSLLPTHGKLKLIVGGISSMEVILYYHASRRAGVKPRSLQLAPVSLINGFKAAHPEIFNEHAVVLLDLGFLSSSLTILDKGKPLLTRAVPGGGKQITEYIAQMSNMDFAKAETAKLEGDPSLGEAVSRISISLIREVRSSINFFEKNSDQTISKVYVTGAGVVSPVVIEALSKDIERTCEPWSTSRGLIMQLPPEQQGIFAKNEFAFSTALGAARTYTVAETPKAQGKVTSISNPAISKPVIQPPA